MLIRQARQTVFTIVVVGLMAGLLSITGTVSGMLGGYPSSGYETTLTGGSFAVAGSSVAGGGATWQDGTGNSDTLIVALTGIDQPAAGTTYYGWLVSSDGSTSTNIGALSVLASGSVTATYSAADGANLLGTYNTLAISTSEKSASPAIYSDTLEAEAFVHLGHLLVAQTGNPSDKGILVGLREQAQLALNEAKLASAATTLDDKQTHLKRLINIVGGTIDSNYDASAGDSGDGYGVLRYSTDAATHAKLADAGAASNPTVTTQVAAVVAATGKVTSSASAALNNAVIGAGEAAEGLILDLAIQNAVTNMTEAVTENGANKAYVDAQGIAKMVPVKGTALPVVPVVVEAPDTGDISLWSYATSATLAGFVLIASGSVLLWRRKVMTD
jgi:hypothetical protein